MILKLHIHVYIQVFMYIHEDTPSHIMNVHKYLNIHMNIQVFMYIHDVARCVLMQVLKSVRASEGKVEQLEI